MVATYGILLVGVGAFNLYFARKFRKDPAFAESYIRKSPKAWLWRKMLGEERALKVTQKVFVPMAFVLGVVLILGGLASF